MLDVMQVHSIMVHLTKYERGELKQQIVELFCKGNGNFSLELMENKYPEIAKLFLLL